jgi:membrane associated rhomboid family serine protease
MLTVRLAAQLVVVLWVVFFANIVIVAMAPGLDVRAFGILPRTARGLIGIVFAPLLHGNLPHLIANTVPLLVLVSVLGWHSRGRALPALSGLWLLSGMGTWLIGRPGTLHIGASGVIYGLIAYLIAGGFWLRNWRAIVVAITVLLVYGGVVWGILPQASHVSWEGHLSGAVSGIVMAWWFRRR